MQLPSSSHFTCLCSIMRLIQVLVNLVAAVPLGTPFITVQTLQYRLTSLQYSQAAHSALCRRETPKAFLAALVASTRRYTRLASSLLRSLATSRLKWLSLLTVGAPPFPMRQCAALLVVSQKFYCILRSEMQDLFPELYTLETITSYPPQKDG